MARDLRSEDKGWSFDEMAGRNALDRADGADLVYKYKLLFGEWRRQSHHFRRTMAAASSVSSQRDVSLSLSFKMCPTYRLDALVYFKPYESNGEAWRITFNRLLWALITFQLFMTGIFLLSNLKPPILALAMTPLILYTLWWSWTMIRDFGGLSRFLALSSICEVERGEGADVVAGVRGEDGVSRSQRWVFLSWLCGFVFGCLVTSCSPPPGVDSVDFGVRSMLSFPRSCILCEEHDESDASRDLHWTA